MKMANMQLRWIASCILFWFLIIQMNCQRVRYPSETRRQYRPNWRENDIDSCPNGRTCLPWNRCPPSRRPRRAESQECIYPQYSRRNPGVCCFNNRNPRVGTINSLPPNRTRPPVRFSPPQTTRFNPPVLRTRPPFLGNSDDRACGISQGTSGLVIGGSPARPGVWPWMAAITVNNNGVQNRWCTGFLIDPRHVISAAHCFDRREPDLYNARIGNVDQNQAEVYRFERIAIPDGYQPGLFYDDIAVITLAREVSTPDFMPICLPNPDFRNLTGLGTTVAGWGATRVGGQMTNLLQQLHAIPVVSTVQCNQIFRQRLSSYSRQFPQGVTEGFLCAGFPEGERDSCGGDSGGPLMFPVGGRWYAVGVVSFGLSCALPGVPGGYTRITSHLGFIRRNT